MNQNAFKENIRLMSLGGWLFLHPAPFLLPLCRVVSSVDR